MRTIEATVVLATVYPMTLRRSRGAVPIALRVLSIARVLGGMSLRLAFALVSRRLRRTGTNASGDLVREALASLGPIFVKVGQHLSERPDLMGSEIAFALARLRTRAGTCSQASIEATIERSLGKPVASLFSYFDPVAIGSGSVAQVHRASGFQGTVLAVKVVRPKAVRQAEIDLALLRLLATLADALWPRGPAAWWELYNELYDAIGHQFDLRVEALNQRRFRHIFPEVTIPRVIEELSSDAVLTMEYVPNLWPAERILADSASRAAAARNTIDLFYEMVFDHGLVHADLHEGNLFFATDGNVTLLDFGIIAELPPVSRQRFRDLFRSIALRDVATCADVILASASRVPTSLDRAGFAGTVQELLEDHGGLLAREFEVSSFVRQLFALHARHRIQMSSEFATTILAFLSVEGIIKALAPDLDFQARAVQYLG